MFFFQEIIIVQWSLFANLSCFSLYLVFKGTWVSMGVYSDGSYGIQPGLVYSFPVTCEKGKWSIVQGNLYFLLLSPICFTLCMDLICQHFLRNDLNLQVVNLFLREEQLKSSHSYLIRD